MTRLAYLVSHPIQYQSPLLRRISQEPDIELTVHYMSDCSLKAYQDPGFGVQVKWDVPLTEGIRHDFLEPRYHEAKFPFMKPWFNNLSEIVQPSKVDVLWLHGFEHSAKLRAMHIAKAKGIPILMRSENQLGALKQRSGIHNTLKQSITRYALKTTNAFLPIGTLSRKYYESYGISDDRLFTVPYAVDNQYFRNRVLLAQPQTESLRAELELESGRPIILFASKFLTRKRAADLYQAFRKGKEKTGAYLLFVGDGEEKPNVEAMAARDGERDVRFLGFRNQSELPAFFGLCDLFVLPSSAEQWGLVVNEVMCGGKAVIVTEEVGCGPDLVREGKNGFIYPVGDIDALATCIANVLESPERIRSMGNASLEIINTWDFEADVKGLRDAIDYVRR